MATPPQGYTASAVIDNGSPVVGGTVNGVLYVNSSGNLDSGSVLSFNGTNLSMASGQILNTDGTAALPAYSFTSAPTYGMNYATNALRFSIGGTHRHFMNATTFSILSNTAAFTMGASQDLVLAYDAANILAQRNGTNAQILRVNNTYTAGTPDWEALEINWQASANVAVIRTAANGTGTARVLRIRYGNSANNAIHIPITGVAGGAIVLAEGTSSSANLTRVLIANATSYSATSGTGSELTLDGGPAPSSSSTMIWRGLTISPTINYAAGGAGQIKALYINPTVTAPPTGLNAACVFSSTASTLGGMHFHNQSDEATNYEIARIRYLSNDFAIEATAAGSGTPRFIGFGLAGFGTMWKLKYATANVTCAAGATVTATNLIPAKAMLIGVVTRVTTQIGNGTGTTGYTVGDGSDADRWGSVTGLTVGTDTDQSDYTADPHGYFNAANNVVLTALTGNFDGTGVIRVTAIYSDLVAPTS